MDGFRRANLRRVAAAGLMGTGALLALPPLVAPAAAIDDFTLDVTKSHAPANPAPGADVEFTVTVTNPNDFDVTITGVTDAFDNPAGSVSPCDADGPGNDITGTVLSQGESTSPCVFTIPGYAPPAGQARANTVTVTAAAAAEGEFGANYLVVDEGSINNDNPSFIEGGIPKSFTQDDINDQGDINGNPISEFQRSPLAWFNDPDNFGRQITVRGGQTGDPAYFTINPNVPADWHAADGDAATLDGLQDFFGNPLIEPGHEVPSGLGGVPGSVNNGLADDIDGNALNTAEEIEALAGQQLCVLLKDSDVGFNDGDGDDQNLLNLQGGYLGIAGFTVTGTQSPPPVPLQTGSDLPALNITIGDPLDICRPDLALAGSGAAADSVATPAVQATTTTAPTTTAPPTTTTTAAAVVAGQVLELPRTGSGNRTATLVAGILFMVGGGLLAGSTRRRWVS